MISVGSRFRQRGLTALGLRGLAAPRKRSRDFAVEKLLILARFSIRQPKIENMLDRRPDGRQQQQQHHAGVTARVLVVRHGKLLMAAR
jgi:hypothetical protein